MSCWILRIKYSNITCLVGFRSERGTNDTCNLIRLETFIRDAFIKQEQVVVVFFDLEKAYDATCSYGILRYLHELGLKRRLSIFIKSFLADRTIQVRVGSTLSDLLEQKQGVPQVSILSLWFLTCSCCPYLHFGSAIMLMTYFVNFR